MNKIDNRKKQIKSEIKLELRNFKKTDYWNNLKEK